MDNTFIKDRKNKYIMDGIMKDIELQVREVPMHTSFGSTDRKAYTLQFRAIYMEREYVASCDIQPFLSEEQTQKIIEESSEDARYRLAQRIYNEIYA